MPAEYQTTCTIQDYGMKLARAHLHDWLILLLLIVLEGILLIIHPFYRFVGKDMMTDLRYPLKGNTVPFWAVPLYSMALPIVVFVLFYLRRRDVYDLHHATLGNIEQAFSTQIFPKILILLFMILETTGLLFAIFIAAVLTDAIKDSVGRPRPDFFWRCFPDGKDVQQLTNPSISNYHCNIYVVTFLFSHKYDALGNVICHGNRNVIREGHKSFPSGHTSWSFAGLGFLSLYLCGKIKVFDHKGHVWKLCLVIFPVLAAALVGVSRVDDYWHHWQDVFAGGLLGIVVAFFCYHQFFPPPYNMKGWGTYAYFQAMEDMREAEERQIAAGNDINSNVV